ncbi:cytochrome d ubiquinol oxidase subunit II [Kitasatospora sp. RB6PN24]|uniref:cytochrome d ubiquinol oxidase subunit II n=1 Tax=Kitasatospora humi TaxID=2893891 RepID=UPI001E4C62CC|nr:cytochrome d ubiquinol oxidase subunit II [Kitasatospora humi]MCC9310103.1 cytochrome d ubiquinol oxidase subunit II [Kitasatospora humi]
MQDIWFAVLALLLGGYFVGEGYAFGIGILLPLLGRDDRERRTALASLGPFFLGNEVWLVGAAGVLIGVFPRFEGLVLSRLYPLIVAVLLFIAMRDMALHLRSRRQSFAWRSRWDRVFTVGSTGLAIAWGLIVGNLLQGVPSGRGDLLNSFALLCGVTLPALFAAHAAAFLALRVKRPGLARTAVVSGHRVCVLALPLAALAVGTGIATDSVRLAAPHPALELVLGVVLLVAAGTAGALLGRRAGAAFALTSVAALLPVLLVGAVLAGQMRAGATDATTLHLLNWAALPMVPIILAYQGWLWTAFRAPVDRPAYW